MATIDVKDAAGATVAIEKPLTPARKTAALSRPVVVSDEDFAEIQLINTRIGEVAASPTANTLLDRVKSGNASLTTIAAKDFATQTTLAALSGKLPAAITASGNLKVALLESTSAQAVTGTFWQATQPVSGTFWQATQPVSAASLPLPTGAATSAKQDSTEVLIGAVNETPPSTDTSSSGISGRLQRLAQNLTSLAAQITTLLGHTDALETKLDTLNTSIVSATLGTVPHDADAASINSLLVGSHAANARPTAVSAANDAVRMWLDFYGATEIVQSGYDVIDATWTVDSAALANGDVMATTPLEIASFFRSSTGVVKIHGVTIHDPDEQMIGMDLYLQNASQSLGTQNGGPTITDANGETIIGIVPVDASDFYDVGTMGKAIVTFERAIIVKGGGVSNSLWLSGITRGTPTYAGATLKLKFQIEHVG